MIRFSTDKSVAHIGSDSGITTTYEGCLFSPDMAARGQIMYGLSGALSADTWKTVLTVTGKGHIDFAAATVVDTTSRTIGIRLTINGVVYYERGSTPIITTNRGLTCVGMNLRDSYMYGFAYQPIPFVGTMSLAIKSSLTETDKLYYYYHYVLIN